MSLSPVVRQMLAGLSTDDLARLPDAELLKRFDTGRDESAFAALIERHGPIVLGVCRRTLGNVHDAEDAAQAVFLVLARNVRRVRKPEALSAWLHGVAVRVSRKALARRRKAEALPAAIPATEPLDPTWADARRVIDAALASLPESLRLPLVLCYLEGLTRDEAAGRLGLSLDTFRGRLERGREKLRAALARRGFPLAAGLLAVLLESPASASPLWVSATTALSTGSVPPSPEVAYLAAGTLPMKLMKYLVAGSVLLALAFGGALWAAGTAPPPEAPAPRQAAPMAAEEPVPILPKDRTGVWRSVVISDNGNRIDRHAIRFLSATEIIWETHGRSPGSDGRRGTRYKYATTSTGLKLDQLAELMSDGLEWDPVPGQQLTSVEYTILPLDKQGSSFQLVRVDARGRKIFDAVFRHEANGPPPADPLVPEYLTKIDRTIKKEPKYVNKPMYVLIAVGPEAKFKVWVVIDGDVAYIDRNGNGDLTEDGERDEAKDVAKNVVRSASGELTYCLPDTKRTSVNPWWYASEQGRTGGFIGFYSDSTVRQFAGGHELNYAPSPEQAAIIHLGSKVVTFRQELKGSIVNEEKGYVETVPGIPDANRETMVFFQVGTPGVGAGNRRFSAGSFAAFTHTATNYIKKPTLLPPGVHPIAEYEFIPLNPADSARKVTVKLTEHLDATVFAAKLTVPDGVKTGLDAAKVMLSFPNCPWGKVEPVTLTVDVLPKRK